MGYLFWGELQPFSIWKFNLFSQVSSEEEQEKPGNFIQGKPRMSLVGEIFY